MKLYDDFFELEVYKHAGPDCSNGGASSIYSTIFVVKDRIKPDEVKEYCKSHRIDERRFFYVNTHRGYYKRLVPVFDYGQWCMAGGNFAYSCDSRYPNFTGIEYPISIHDRFEEYYPC